MQLKVLTCDCILSYLNDTKIEFEVHRTFGACECNLEHKIVAITCHFHPLNVNGFARNYFASANCSCVNEQIDRVYKHCASLENALNINVKKVCPREENLPKQLFKYLDFYEYSEKKLPGDPFFVFDYDLNCVCTRIDAIDWEDFFIGKETV